MRSALDTFVAARASNRTAGSGVADEEPVELMMDANSVWEVGEAIEEMEAMAELRPRWIEEPISPDDVVGQGAIADALRSHGIAVASGEQCQNKVRWEPGLRSHLALTLNDTLTLTRS